MQPEINVRIAKASRDHGVGIIDKTIGFLSESLGIKISARTNLLRTHEKIKVGIRNVKEQRTEENLKEHNEVTRNLEKYNGDLVWEGNGEIHSTCQGGGAMDGCGLKCSFKNRHTGNQSAFHINSVVTKKPLVTVHYQVSDFHS